jgi:hypothetical protein
MFRAVALVRMVCLAVALSVPMAHAASPTDPLNAFNNMAQETVQCAAYFGIVSVALENSNNLDGAKKYNEFRDEALERAAIVTQQAGLKPETVGARFNMAGRGYDQAYR